MAYKRVVSALEGTGVLALDSCSDPDELALFTDPLRPHRITLHGRDARLRTTLRSAAIAPSLSLHRLNYGHAVTVTPQVPDGENFLFAIVLSGAAKYRYGGDEVVIGPGQVGPIAPYREFRSRMDADFNQLLINVSKERLESLAALLIGEPPATLEFQHTPDMDAQMLAVLPIFESLLHTATSGVGDDSPLAQQRLEDVALESLLLSFPSVRSRLREHGSTGSARLVRDATQLMHERLAEPLALTEISRRLAVSPRTLQLAFRRELDQSPSEWLRVHRLDRAEQLLRSGDPNYATVTNVAYASGFHHLGEFAKHYKQRFGQSPSAALRSRTKKPSKSVGPAGLEPTTSTV